MSKLHSAVGVLVKRDLTMSFGNAISPHTLKILDVVCGVSGLNFPLAFGMLIDRTRREIAGCYGDDRWVRVRGSTKVLGTQY